MRVPQHFCSFIGMLSKVPWLVGPERLAAVLRFGRGLHRLSALIATRIEIVTMADLSLTN